MRQATPTIRQWLLLRALGSRQQGATVQELVRELEVTDKTIRRDLNALAAAGFPLSEEIRPHGLKAFRLTYPAGAPALGFSWDEALALYLGRRFMDPLAGTYLGDAAQQAFRKVRSSLTPGLLKYLDDLAAGLHVTQTGAGDYRRKSETIDALLRAVAERRMAIITYQSQRATEPVEYADIHPYGIGSHKNSLYLVAWSGDHGQVRTFKIDRLASVEVTGLPFQRPDDFDLQQYFSGSFGIFHGDGDITVRLRFAPAVVRYVEEGQWHSSQQLARQRDGSLHAQFRLSSLEEITRWILSFGRQVEVLGPEELRRAVADEISEMSRPYAQRIERTPRPDNNGKRPVRKLAGGDA